MNENERLSLLNLFPQPDVAPLDQADIQQFIIFRTPLAGQLAATNMLQYGSKEVLDVKYFDGVQLIDMVLQMNGVIVWSK